MPVHAHEALACLKLIVCIAKADGEICPEERAVLSESLSEMTLPEGTTAEALLAGNWDVDALIAEIASPDAREAAFSACFSMAHADRQTHAAEQAILEKIENAWAVTEEKKGLFGRMMAEAKDTVSWSRIQPIADPARREKEITEDVQKYAILAGTLGLFPIPVAKLATELAVVGVQGKLVRDIGQYWGQETTKDGVKQILAGMGVGQVGRVALNTLLGFVPVLGSVIPAAANYASTWAVGRVANQFYASGGTLSAAAMKDMFSLKKKEGKAEYEKNKAAVAAAAEKNKAALEVLAADYKAGKITQAEYEQKVLELG